MAKNTNAPALFIDLPKTPGAAISTIAAMKGQLSSGALYMVHNFPKYADDCMLSLGAAKKKKTPIRDAMLTVWHETPEGAYHAAVKQEAMLTPPKGRSTQQKELLAEGKKLENAINIQAQRIADAWRGVSILSAAGFKVTLKEAEGSKTWFCYIRNEAGLGEQDNQKLTADNLVALANLKSHNVTAKTAATDVLGKVSGKRKAGKKKGAAQTNPVADLVNKQTGDVLAALDTRLAALVDSDKKLIEGVSPATREAFHRLFARLTRSLTQEAQDAALAAFDADAATEAPKPRRRRAA